jgi:AbiV family abortive infection protein
MLTNGTVDRSPLTRDEIASLAEAARDNAGALISAAELLLREGHEPRAYALAALAVEEIGKVVLLLGVGVRVTLGGGQVNWQGFWEKFFNHGDKAFNAIHLEYVIADQFEAWATGDAEAVHADTTGLEHANRETNAMVELRRRALYVDYHAGQVRRPEEQISRVNAEMLVSAAKGMAERIQSLDLVADAARLKAMARDPLWRDRAADLRRRIGRLPRSHPKRRRPQ